MKLKAFVIHLERAKERQPQVAQLRSTLPMPTDIVDAVDSRNLTSADIQRAYKRNLHQPYYPFDLSQNEIACFLSHRRAWQSIIDQDLDAGLILEDDVELTATFPAALQAALTHIDSCGFIRFTFRDGKEFGQEVYRNEQVRLIAPLPIGLGMVAQLVTQSAARRLLAVTEQFDRPVDTFAQMKWVTGLSPLAVIPGGVREISSTLGGSTVQRKKSLLGKIQREILRPFYRNQVRRFSNRAV